MLKAALQWRGVKDRCRVLATWSGHDAAIVSVDEEELPARIGAVVFGLGLLRLANKGSLHETEKPEKQ